MKQLTKDKSPTYTNKIYAALYLKKKKKEIPNRKMGTSKWTFLQKQHTDGQKEHEKMINITNDQRNQNQYYSEVSQPHTSQNGHHQKVYK